MRCSSKWRLTLLFLIGGPLLGCQRGPRTTIEEVAKAEAAKPKAKVVRPAPESGLVRLRTVRAFREWGVRDTAADALARIGEPAVPALIDTLHDDDPSIRAQAPRLWPAWARRRRQPCRS